MRIEQRSGFLLDSLRELQVGRLVPAAFQRPYVWERSDVDAFWTSLVKQYPMGSLLVWQPHSSVDTERLARGRIGPIAATSERPGILLDGQNRLATFAWSMRGPDDPLPTDMSKAEAETWGAGFTLVADGRDKTISFRKDADARDPHCFAPGLLLSAAAMGEMRRRTDQGTDFSDDEIRYLFDEVPRYVREGRVTSTELMNATPDEALEAFRHICRVGKPMSEDDYEAAMAWAFEDRAPAPR